MTDRVAIVTGGLRGLGRGMTLGLASSGVRVLAVGHLPEDIPAMEGIPNVRPMIADVRSPAACDKVVAAAMSAFGRLDILVNNAGLTFTYIDPARFRREKPRKFWEVEDEVIQNVMDTNATACTITLEKANSRGCFNQRSDNLNWIAVNICFGSAVP